MIAVSGSLPPARPVIALGGLGGLVIGIAWFQAAGTLRVGHQTQWALIGGTGAAAVVLAALAWILTARRAVEHRLDAVLARLGSVYADPDAAIDVRVAIPAATPADRLVATETMVRYHRAACPLAAGKPVAEATWVVHEAAGRRPCGVCVPGTSPPPLRATAPNPASLQGTDPNPRVGGRP